MNVLGVALAAFALAGASPTDTVLLGAKGRALVAAGGISVDLRGLKPLVLTNVLLKAGTCKRQSASFALILSRKASATGTLKATGKPRFHGEVVSHRIVADGDHLVVVVQGGRVLGCGAIPGLD
jgi:hypothetical protein